MSADITFTRTVNNLPRIMANMTTTAVRLVAKATMDMEAQMKSRVPVDTGNLKNSIQSQKLGAQHWRITVGAEYAPHVEYGTIHMGPQPFFNPAVDVVTPQFYRAWEKLVTL